MKSSLSSAKASYFLVQLTKLCTFPDLREVGPHVECLLLYTSDIETSTRCEGLPQ
jgi:hypothetical protein